MATRPPADSDHADTQLAGAVRESAEQIWLAGLGAFAMAQKEGTKMFEALVRDGQLLQRRTRAATGERIEEVAGRFTEAATQLTRQASQSWDKLEQLFEDRVARALARLGVPSPRDIRELTSLLEALNDRIEAMDKPRAAAGPARTEANKATQPARAPRPSNAVKPSKDSNASKASTLSQPTMPTKPAKPAKPSRTPRVASTTRAAKSGKTAAEIAGGETPAPGGRRTGKTADKA